MKCMASSFTLRTGSRLHCGLFSDNRPGGYRHQGIGFMIDSPGFVISAAITPTSGNQIHAPTEFYPRIENILTKLDRSVSHQGERRFLEIRVESTVPLHCGFGAGTQLALAIGKLWSLFNQPELITQQLARILKRSQRSCIGTYGFDMGGMLIDRGIAPGKEIGECRFRASLPEHWRFLLVRPPEVKGISGEEEIKAFHHLPGLNPEKIDQLQQLLTIMQSKPDCFRTLSSAIREYGLIVGESFAPIQGDVFSTKFGKKVFDLLSEDGLQGIAQSSWGPTIFGLCEDSGQAATLRQSVLGHFPEAIVTIACPKNTGVEVSE